MVFIAKRRDDFVFNRGIAMLAAWGEELVEVEVTVHLAVTFVESDMFLQSTTAFEVAVLVRYCIYRSGNNLDGSGCQQQSRYDQKWV